MPASECVAWKCGSPPWQHSSCHPIINYAMQKGRDKYGRVVGVCSAPLPPAADAQSGAADLEDLNAWMVQQGWAVAYRCGSVKKEQADDVLFCCKACTAAAAIYSMLPPLRLAGSTARRMWRWRRRRARPAGAYGLAPLRCRSSGASIEAKERRRLGRLRLLWCRQHLRQQQRQQREVVAVPMEAEAAAAVAAAAAPTAAAAVSSRVT